MGNKTVQFSVRMSVSMRQRIEELAAKERRSLANQILCLLETALSGESAFETETGALNLQATESDPSALSACAH